MPIDPSIILGVRPAQIQQRDPLESYGKVLGLKAAMGQGELQDLQVRQARDAMADEEAVKDAYRQSAGDMGTLKRLLTERGSYKQVQNLDKAELERREKEAKIRQSNAAAGKSEYDVKIAGIERGAAVLSTAKDQRSYDAARRQMALTFGPESVAQMPEQFDPAFVQAQIAQGMTIAQQLADERARQQNAETERGNRAREAQTAANAPFVPGPTGPVPQMSVQQYEIGKSQAGATRVQNNVNAYTPASEEAQKDFMKGLRTRYDALQPASAMLDNIEKAKALVPSASQFMGSGANAKLTAAKFLNNNLGAGINTEGVQSAEELNARLFMGVMENLKKMDSQPSQSQQAALQQALGQIGTDPAALPRVLDVFGDIVRQKVDIHNREAQGAIERGVKFPYDPTIQIPQKPAAAPKPAATAAPALGTRKDGYIYKGGDPASPASWEKERGR